MDVPTIHSHSKEFLATLELCALDYDERLGRRKAYYCGAFDTILGLILMFPLKENESPAEDLETIRKWAYDRFQEAIQLSNRDPKQ